VGIGGKPHLEYSAKLELFDVVASFAYHIRLCAIPIFDAILTIEVSNIAKFSPLAARGASKFGSCALVGDASQIRVHLSRLV
jgi:hypothetical protein